MAVRSNEVIKKNVVDQIFWDHRVDASDINVVVEAGKVSLNGSVSSFTAKNSAGSDAWMVEGVKSVENNIKVKFPEGFAIPSDSEIESNVKDSLLYNSEIDSTKIGVKVTAGIVTLTGDVDAYWKKLNAEGEAQNITGVVDVVNKLAIVPTESILDRDIAEDIVQSIDRNLNVLVDDVTVEVDNGSVELIGTVPDWNAYNAAMDAARFTAGVIEIEDNLIIQS